MSPEPDVVDAPATDDESPDTVEVNPTGEIPVGVGVPEPTTPVEPDTDAASALEQMTTFQGDTVEAFERFAQLLENMAQGSIGNNHLEQIAAAARRAVR